MSHLDPLADRSLQFVFAQCQARLDGNELIVAVPGATFRASSGDALAWTDAAPAGPEVIVECDPGPRRRLDRHEYPVSPAYTQGTTTFRFRGGFTYGRVASEGGWALCVDAQVRALSGLPGPWPEWDAVLVAAAAAPMRLLASADAGVADSPTGPHLPYP